jgi:hypothetical protein
MPFIGNQPALSYTSFAKQDFTTSATTSYTLDNPVTNENELALFINFVRQEPTTAYTASGTTLTLTSATSATDDMYCVFLGKAVQTVNPPNGSVGASQIADSSIALGKLSATGTKDATTFLRGDNTFASAGGVNTPAFMANLGSGQSISNNTSTKVNMDTEIFDTDGTYDHSTNYRFTPAVAGKYFVYAQIMFTAYGADGTSAGLQIKKNGSTIHESYEKSAYNSNFDFYIHISATVVLDDDDYIEIFALQSSGASKTIYQGSLYSFWGAYKIIE